MIRVLVILFVLLSWSLPLFAQEQAQDQIPEKSAEEKETQKNHLYQWTDGKGVVHITDGLGKVPKKYRSKATKLEAGTKSEAGDAAQPQEAVAPRVLQGQQQQSEEENKFLWQTRIQNVRQRLADAEARYRDLEQKKMTLLETWGGNPALGHLRDQTELDNLEKELTQAKQEVESARYELEVEIPDEARKSEVPPGWLRE